MQRFPTQTRLFRSLSTGWKAQRDADLYANRAIKEGKRSRAAYKLEEINKRFGFFLRQGACVLDLGASPGGFSVVAADSIRLDSAIDRWHVVDRIANGSTPPPINRTLGGSQPNRKFGKLICVDQQEMKNIPGAMFIQGDMRSPGTVASILHCLERKEVDVVLSDMAPNTTGDKQTNHVRIIDLADEALKLACAVLRNGGTFCCKIFSGVDEARFRDELRQYFVKVRAFRPAASRRVSTEIYYVAQGFVPDHMVDSNTTTPSLVEHASAA